jgi:hypothetical protein
LYTYVIAGLPFDLSPPTQQALLESFVPERLS